MLMTLIASILGQKGITPDTFSVNARVRGVAEPPEAALDRMLGGGEPEPPP